jgi:hypothetical protein
MLKEYIEDEKTYLTQRFCKCLFVHTTTSDCGVQGATTQAIASSRDGGAERGASDGQVSVDRGGAGV